MSSQPVLPPPAAPAAKPPSIPSTATTTTLPTAAYGTTTISSLGQDQLLEIFLRLPSLPALVRAALTCRSWLNAIRSSRSFRSLFRALHPAPLIGIFLQIEGGTAPSFAPVRRSDPDVTAAICRGDFFLTSLPAGCWSIMDCCDGYILLSNMVSVAVHAMEGTSSWFHLLSSEENPWSFRVVCVCAHLSRVRAAVFFGFMLVGGSFYRPLYGKGCAIRINTATMDVSSLYLPSQAKEGVPKVGDTEDGKLCMVYATEDFLLLVWIRSGDGDGIESWVLQDIIRLRAEMDQTITTTPWQWEGQVEVVQVRRTEHEVEGSCSCLLKSSNSTKQKRKSSSLKETSPVGLAVDFNSVDVVRQPLSPLQPKSPDCGVHKK
ncbi:hypothetical protein VPH35_107446 [Triticum aestivum]